MWAASSLAEWSRPVVRQPAFRGWGEEWDLISSIAFVSHNGIQLGACFTLGPGPIATNEFIRIDIIYKAFAVTFKGLWFWISFGFRLIWGTGWHWRFIWREHTARLYSIAICVCRTGAAGWRDWAMVVSQLGWFHHTYGTVSSPNYINACVGRFSFSPNGRNVC